MAVVAQALQQRKTMRNPKRILPLCICCAFQEGPVRWETPWSDAAETEEAACWGGSPCFAALSMGDDTAQLLQVDLRLNRSALQSLAPPLLQAWEQRRKVSSPLGLIHALWHFKILTAHHNRWEAASGSCPERRGAAPLQGDQLLRKTRAVQTGSWGTWCSSVSVWVLAMPVHICAQPKQEHPAGVAVCRSDLLITRKQEPGFLPYP